MPIEHQGPASPRVQFYSNRDLPAQSHCVMTSSIHRAIDAVGNSDTVLHHNDDLSFESYPDPPGFFSQALQRLFGCSAPPDYQDLGLQHVMREGAGYRQDAERVRNWRDNLTAPTITGCTAKVNTGVLAGAVGFVVGALVGGGVGWFLSGNRATGGEMRVSKGCTGLDAQDPTLWPSGTDSLERADTPGRAYSTARNRNMGEREGDWCYAYRYYRNSTPDTVDNNRSLYVSGDALEGLELLFAQSNAGHDTSAQDLDSLFADENRERDAFSAADQCAAEKKAKADRGRYFQKWGNTPVINEFHDNEYIKALLAQSGAEIITRDLYALQHLDPVRYQRLTTVINELLRHVDLAMAAVQSVTNSHLDSRPSNDANSAAILPVTREPSGELYMGVPIEKFSNEPADELGHLSLSTPVSDKHFYNALLILMSKVRSSLARLYPDYGNSYLNIMTVNHPQSVKLYATTGNTALAREQPGYNMPNIILGNHFFTLGLYESMLEILQQMTYYYTDTTELFSVMPDRYCHAVAKIDTAEHREWTYYALHDAGKAVQQFNKGENINIEWNRVREAPGLQAAIKAIPKYPLTATVAEQNTAIADHYKNNDEFRMLVNGRNANFLANMILAAGHEQRNIDIISAQFGKKSKDC